MKPLLRALDQGPIASSSQTQRGTGGSRDDRGQGEGKEGGWQGGGKEAGDSRTGLEEGGGVRETGPPAWREGHSQQGGSEACCAKDT